MTGDRKKFNWRGWTTFVVTISFIVDTLSGIILYIAPAGRIANWTDWKIWGLDKETWGAIHTIFGYVLLIIVGIHLYYNWRMFLNFIWSKIKKAVNLKWELLFAAFACLIIFLGTLWHIPPFSSTMELGEYFKASWEESKVETPIAHGELLSLEEFANNIQIPPDELLDTLRSKGYEVKDLTQTLGDIARENQTSPQSLYEVIKPGDANVAAGPPATYQGSGVGRKTLEGICAERGIPLDVALSRLKRNGIDALPSDGLKDIAGRTGITPLELLDLIEKQE